MSRNTKVNYVVTERDRRAFLSALWMRATHGADIRIEDPSEAPISELREQLRACSPGSALRDRLQS